MPKALILAGSFVLFGAGGCGLLAFNEWMTAGGLSYTAAAFGIAAFILLCGGMLLLGAASMLDRLHDIADGLFERVEDDETPEAPQALEPRTSFLADESSGPAR